MDRVQWERDNSLIRDLELSQTFLITLDISLWSGHSRKVEIAESFVQCLLTILRRGGKFRSSGYEEIVIPPDCDEDTLQHVWQTWVVRESFKRLCFRSMQHDSYSSMALLAKPLVSYAEVSVPFPDSFELWQASSAQEWASIFSTHSNVRNVNLADYLDDPEGFYAGAHEVDVTIAESALLSCAWCLAWDYVQGNTMRRASPRRWNSLLQASRLDELLRLLTSFRLCAETTWTAKVAMRLEHILLHLHVPFEDIHVFAGMEGPKQAQAVHSAVADWAETEAARCAVWHAGQVIRAAKQLPPRTLQGSVVVMLYHSGLVLWAYGLLSSSGLADDGWSNAVPAMAQGFQSVSLEEPEGISLQRFMQFGSGYPYIKDGVSPSSPDVFLSQPEKILDVVVGILRDNHDDAPRPPIVERLIQLMLAVQQASRSQRHQ